MGAFLFFLRARFAPVLSNCQKKEEQKNEKKRENVYGQAILPYTLDYSGTVASSARGKIPNRKVQQQAQEEEKTCLRDDVTHKGGKKTEVSIMCCGNGWGGFVPILTEKVFAQFKEKDNKKKQNWLYLKFTFYLYMKKKHCLETHARLSDLFQRRRKASPGLF